MTILAAESQTGIRLVFPEVVVDELRNLVNERLDETVKAVNKSQRMYDELTGPEDYSVDFVLTVEQRQAVLDRFERRIGRLYNEGRILTYPSPSPKELAQRSIKVQPPFLNEDRGLRDTLLWLTAMESVTKDVNSGTKVTLVSKDRAFWDKDNSIMNEGLTAELQETGVSPDSIVVMPTLQEVVSTFVSAKLPPAEWVRVAIQGGHIIDFTNFNDTVQLKADDWILNNPEILNFSGAFLFVEFDVVVGTMLQRIEQTLDLGNDKALVESRWTCDVVAEGFNNPYYADNLFITLEFDLSSIVKIDNDRLSVQSHEVTDMEVTEFIESEPE